LVWNYFSFLACFYFLKEREDEVKANSVIFYVEVGIVKSLYFLILVFFLILIFCFVILQCSFVLTIYLYVFESQQSFYI